MGAFGTSGAWRSSVILQPSIHSQAMMSHEKAHGKAHEKGVALVMSRMRLVLVSVMWPTLLNQLTLHGWRRATFSWRYRRYFEPLPLFLDWFGCSIQIISTISWMPVTIRRQCFRCYPYPPEKGWIRKVNLGAGEAGPPVFRKCAKHPPPRLCSRQAS